MNLVHESFEIKLYIKRKLTVFTTSRSSSSTHTKSLSNSAFVAKSQLISYFQITILNLIMKGIFFSFVLALICSVSFAVSVPEGRFIPTSIKQAAMKRVQAEGCNANICFGIDGSGSVNLTEFQKAKDFVKDIVDIIAVDQEAEFCAVQFSLTNDAISPLTADKFAFLNALAREPYISGGATAIGAAIVYSDFQLSRRLGEANKIVVITDGRNNAGGDPVRRANNFRRRDPNGRVCAVGIGKTLKAPLEEIAAGEPVLEVDEYVQLATIVDNLVNAVCGYN